MLRTKPENWHGMAAAASIPTVLVVAWLILVVLWISGADPIPCLVVAVLVGVVVGVRTHRRSLAYFRESQKDD